MDDREAALESRAVLGPVARRLQIRAGDGPALP
jgi:hypothetical protein